MTCVRFLNRRGTTRTPPAAVVNCVLPVAAVYAGSATCIYTLNDCRGITHARPSPSVPALSTSKNIYNSITFASVRRQYQ